MHWILVDHCHYEFIGGVLGEKLNVTIFNSRVLNLWMLSFAELMIRAAVYWYFVRRAGSKEWLPLSEAR